MIVSAFSRLALRSLTLLAVACAPAVKATAYRSLAAKASAADVEIYTDVRPQRPYEELGIIEVKSSGIGPNADNGQLILAARARAAAMGADAILVTLRPIESVTTVGHVAPRRKGGDYVETESVSERSRISVVAIIWKQPS